MEEVEIRKDWIYLSPKEKSKQARQDLKRAYPNAIFRIRTTYLEMRIRTDLIIEYPYEWVQIDFKNMGQNDLTQEEYEILHRKREADEHNRKMRDEIQKVVNLQHIRYDERSGEILSGGNFYVFVEGLNH